MTSRRQFIALLGGAAATWPGMARASTVPRIALLGDPESFSRIEARADEVIE